MQSLRHFLELVDLLAQDSRTRVSCVWGEVAYGDVPPIVRETFVELELVLDGLLDGEEFHRGNPEVFEVVYRVWSCKTSVGAPLSLLDFRMELGETLDVKLVYDRLLPW